MISYIKAIFILLPPPAPGPPGPPGVPIDNGIIFLFISAIIIGAYFISKRNKISTN